MTPAQIVTTGLTHLNLAYAGIDPKTFAVIPSDHPDDVALYKEFTARRTAAMQTWIAVGGFDFSNENSPSHRTWSLMVTRSDSRATFIASLSKFMNDHGFQGVDLDWEYPSAGDRGGSTNDAANYVALVREMRVAWGKDYGISATLPPGPYLRGFDPKGMEPYVDFFNYISYDLRVPGTTDMTVRPHTDIRDIEKETVALQMLSPQKINIGLSNYGRGYTLAARSCTHIGCKVSGPSKPGLCTDTTGLLSNAEIHDLIQQHHLVPELVPDTMSKQLVWNDQWIGFDDAETLAQKTAWASESCFGGTMIWTLDMDAGEGSGSTPVGAGAHSGTTHISTSTSYSTQSQPIAAIGTSTRRSTNSEQRTEPVIPAAVAPGRSTARTSTLTSSNTNPSQQSGPSQLHGSSTSARSVQSARTSPSSKSGATVAPAVVSTTLVVPGVATISVPTISPGSMVIEGPPAVLGLIPLAIGIQKGLLQGQEAITKLSQSNVPDAEAVEQAVIILARVYALEQMLDDELDMIKDNTIPSDAKNVIEQVKKSLPEIQGGTRDSINHLTNSIKEVSKIKRVDRFGVKVNKEEIQKADQLLGKQGSVTQKVITTFKPLTGWKAPIGSNDIILPGKMTLPSPSLGDNWKGTTIPGILAVPAPTLHWDKKPIMADTHAGSSSGNGGQGTDGNGGAGGGTEGGSLLSGLLGLATQAEVAVRNVARTVINLSVRQEMSPSGLSNILAHFTTATQDVGGYGAALDDIEMSAFAPADVTKVVNIQNANRSLFTQLQNTLNQVARYITAPPRALQVLKTQSPAYVAGGTILGLLALTDSAAIVALSKNLSKARPALIVPLPSNSTRSNSTTEEVTKEEYFLVTMPNTPVEAYQKFILTLPDGGVGQQRHYEWPRKFQSYLGRMTQQEAESVSENKIVEGIVANKKKSIRWNHVDASRKDTIMSGTQQKRNATRLAPRDLVQEDESELHLRMISCDPQSRLRNLRPTMQDPQYDYQHDDSSGQGATIYILDDGFEFTHQEFDRGDNLKPRVHVPIAYGNISVAPGSHHGDPIAALAVGDLSGVANKANLVGVKVNDASGDETIAGAYDNWYWVISDVQFRAITHGWLGKAVINYSRCKDLVKWMTFKADISRSVNYARWGLTPPERFDVFLPLLESCWMADIVTVFAVGSIREEDNEDKNIGHISPQRYANPNNPMIVVGAVDRDGLPSVSNRRVGPTGGAYGRDIGLTGQITVYALGEGVDIIQVGTESAVMQAVGTSFAAPQVAGLAAYYFSVPGHMWQRGQVAMQMKNLIFNTRRGGQAHPNCPDGRDIAFNSVNTLPGYCQPGTNVRAKPRGWPIDSETISDYIAWIFKRQRKDHEKKLTDPKSSDQVVQPKTFVLFFQNIADICTDV
ncbi:MAG: hypothetical protein Q9224_003786 [Gallowayella concinna]